MAVLHYFFPDLENYNIVVQNIHLKNTNSNLVLLLLLFSAGDCTQSFMHVRQTLHIPPTQCSSTCDGEPVTTYCSWKCHGKIKYDGYIFVYRVSD